MNTRSTILSCCISLNFKIMSSYLRSDSMCSIVNQYQLANTLCKFVCSRIQYISCPIAFRVETVYLFSLYFKRHSKTFLNRTSFLKSSPYERTSLFSFSLQFAINHQAQIFQTWNTRARLLTSLCRARYGRVSLHLSSTYFARTVEYKLAPAVVSSMLLLSATSSNLDAQFMIIKALLNICRT